MKYLEGFYYVEVKDHRHRIHPTENIIFRLPDSPNSLRTQYKVQFEAQIRKNQKVIRDGKNELIVKNYPKIKQPIIQQRKFKLPSCPCCRRKVWLEFDEGYFRQYCEYNINKQKHQIEKKIVGQDHHFSTRLLYANKRVEKFG